MKTGIAISLLVIGSIVGMYYGSCYVMGGIEGGLPGGGAGHYRDYHKGNVITDFFQGNKRHGSSRDYTIGDVSSNPFTE